MPFTSAQNLTPSQILAAMGHNASPLKFLVWLDDGNPVVDSEAMSTARELIARWQSG